MQQRNPRSQAAAYVPPHRRRQAPELASEKSKGSSDVPAGAAPSADIEEPYPISGGDFAGATLVIWGFPSDSTEPERAQLSRPLISAGGVEAWISRTELVIAYRNSGKAAEAMQIQINHVLRRSLLVDFSGESTEEAMEGRSYSFNYFCMITWTLLLTVGLRLYNSIRPVRDVSVANRFISSALGIKPPSAQRGSSAAAAASREKARRGDSPPREDAWD